MRRFSLVRFAVLPLMCIAVAEGVGVRAQEASLPDPVRAALDRYGVLDSLAVSWSENVEGTAMGQKNIGEMVLGNFSKSSQSVQQVAFREGRIFLRRETFAPLPRADEFSFDGKILYSAHPVKGRGLLNKWRPENDRAEGNYFRNGYFSAAGIRIASHVKELLRSWRPQSDVLTLVAEGGKIEAVVPATLNGGAMIRVQIRGKDWRLQGVPGDLAAVEKHLRFGGKTDDEVKQELALSRKLQETGAPTRRYDFYLDPEHGHSVRRLEIRDDGDRLLTRSECMDYEKVAGRDAWMPRLCRVENYTFVQLRDPQTLVPRVFEAPLYVTVFHVSAVDVQRWDDDRFRLDYKTPGVLVNDATLPESTGTNGVSYRIPADQSKLDEVIESARGRVRQRATADEWSVWLKPLFLVINAVLIAVVGIYYLQRRRKAATK